MIDEQPVLLRRGRPLTPMQRPLWMSQRRHPDVGLQNMALLSHLDGPVDPRRLADAFSKVVGGSDALRTTIDDASGTPLVVLAPNALPSEIIDLPRAAAHGWATARARQAVDTTRCAYDSVILRHEDATVSWYLALHHVVTDATSSSLVFAETAKAYADEEIRSASYYDWAQSLERRDDARTRRAASFWRERRDAPGVGRLYRAVRRPTAAASRLQLPLDDRLVTDAEDRLGNDYAMVSNDLGWTALLLTAASVYLHRTARVDRFSVGVPVHNRTDADARSLIGPVMEVFPVDVTIEPGDTFRSLHRRTSRSLMQTLRHAAAGSAPSGDYEAVVNVIPRTGLVAFGDVVATTEWIHSGAADPSHLFRLQLTGYGTDGRELLLDLNDAVADGDHRARAGRHLVGALRAMIEAPDGRIGDVALATEDELAMIGRWEAGPEIDRALEAGRVEEGVVEMLRRALVDHHDTVLEDGARELSGVELWSSVTALAEWLIDQGVRSGVRVGVELRRSADAVIAIMATLVAGGSYVPLDPEQPEARRRRLAERASCLLVLDALPDLAPLAAGADIDGGHGTVRASPLGSDEAYLLFTSGSTGTPKGVPITHLGLAGYLRFAMSSYLAPDERPVVPLFSALTFDLTVTSLFLPLVTRGRLVVVRDDGPTGLATVAARTDITWCKATPSHLEILQRLLPPAHRLSTLVVGGEAFGTRLARRISDTRPKIRIFNEYGPTEAVVGCMIHEVSTDDLAGSEPDVPIGVPAPGVALRVVDEYLQRVPLGSPGELLIAHAGLTAGYLDGDDGAFVELDGERFYRSGDLVRLADPSTLVYLGRIDEQVKVGGIRLEPTEVEDALASHPAIERAAVRLWSPTVARAEQHCVTCGLPSNVPGVRFDDAGVCDTCRRYERIAPVVASWFRSADDLIAVRDRARSERTGTYDCVALLSGGKDSTYALYRLVELGFQPYALTLDNGFISDQAKENIRRTIEHLGIDHEFATVDSMNAIFRDSLERYSNVCNGCFKTIYTVATNRAEALGAPVIVTGLSRGQLFETRLVPQQFTEDRFDPDAIDRAVLEARRVYHRTDDAPNRLLDTDVFRDDDVFDRIHYVDFYRYVDVALSDMLSYLAENAPWVRPTDTGRSTNCRINDIGIHTHLIEQGFHNYAVPYAWDVRLGHKLRSEAIAELDDRLDDGEVREMLGAVGYEPAPRQILTAWLQLLPNVASAPSPAELRAFLGQVLPTFAVPAAFVTVDQLPITTNGKLDTRSLPAPERVHRSSPAIYVSPESSLESTIVTVWERVLRVEPIGLDDDFFALGGDSLAALEMIVALGDGLGRTISEDIAFLHRTPRLLADALEHDLTDTQSHQRPIPPPVAADPAAVPALSVGEQTILFDHQRHLDDRRYNLGQRSRVHGTIDGERFESALRDVASRHVPLSWSFGSTRRRLASHEAVEVVVADTVFDEEQLAERSGALHRAEFDLEHGPLLRCLVQPMADGTTSVTLAMHHVCGDAESLSRLWNQIDAVYSFRPLPQFATDLPGYTTWLAGSITEVDRLHWTVAADSPVPARLEVVRPPQPGPDGFLRRRASFSPDALRRGAVTTPFATALASLACVLRRSSDGDRIGVGVIASTRMHPAAEPLVGFLLNTLPIEFDCSLTAPIREVATQASVAIATGLAHRAVPLADIVTDRRRSGAPAPSLDVLLAFHELRSGRLAGLTVDHDVLFNGTAVADATFFVEVRDDRVDLAMEYRGSVLTEADATRLLADLDATIGAAIDAPDAVVADISTPSDGSSTLRTDATEAWPSSVVGRIVAHEADQPSRPAVTCGTAQLTWAELGARSEAIAAALASNGVTAGDRVVVCVPRSPDLVAAIMAVLRMGASYVPIDPAYPAARRSLIAEMSGARAALVADPGLSLTGLDLDVCDIGVGAPATAAGESLPTGAGPIGPDTEAYLIFTSGSTGTPKGVAVSHRQLAWSTSVRRQVYEREPERFLLLSSCAFDSSVAGLFWTLLRGGEIVLPTEDEVHDPDALLRLIATHEVTHTLLVPTLYLALLERGVGMTSWPAVVVVAGEACSGRLVDLHHSIRPRSELFDEYGPTETTVWATVHRCEPGDDPVPIGKPVPGAWVRVVDPTCHERPAGVAGELVIGGAGLTRGYIGGDRTASTGGSNPGDRFVELPDGERVFRTGDRAVVRDGLVYFLGRGDHQLNLGGVRAEPEEIERVLCGHPHVGAALVVATDTRSLDQLMSAASPATLGAAMEAAAGTADPRSALIAGLRALDPRPDRLVAHLEAAPSATIDVDDVRASVRTLLPALLRPTIYVVHDRLPRTPNGKLDRDAARDLAVDNQAPGTADRPHATDAADGSDSIHLHHVVAVVRDQFRTVLGTGAIADHDSFFDLGGHSLLALELVRRLEIALDVSVSVSTLYRASSPAELGAHIAGDITNVSAATPDAAGSARRTSVGGGSGSNATLLVPVQPKGTRPPLFGIHVLGRNAMFFRPLSERLGPDQPVYGLGNTGSADGVMAPTDVAEVCLRYADEIDRCAPDGMVHLAAVSIGATHAIEVAGILRGRGRDVGLLALFDSAGPDAWRYAPSTQERIRLHIGELGRHPLRYVDERSRRYWMVAARTAQRIEMKVRTDLRRPLPDRLRLRAFVEDNIEATLVHHVQPFHGRLTVFKAGDDVFTASLARYDMGWSHVAIGGVDVIVVPGGHLTMLQPPHVDRLAEEFATALARAERTTDAGGPQGGAALEQVLVHALHSGRFCAAVREQSGRRDLLDDDARALVDRADSTTRAIASGARELAFQAEAALAAAAVPVTIQPVPARAQLASITVHLDRGVGDVDAAIRAVEPLGFGTQDSFGPGAWRTLLRRRSSCTLISHDRLTTRLELTWSPARVTGRFGAVLEPNRADLLAVALPRWAWRAYWLVRPLRLVGERLDPRRTRDLGVFLGTPTDLVVPVLALADPTIDDVLVDLGCGDGRVLIEAARRFGCRGRGVERDPALCAQARAAVASSGLSDRIEIVEGDAADPRVLTGATIVFAFLPPDTVRQLVGPTLDALGPGGRFVTHEQLPSEWPAPPTARRLIVDGGVTVADLWVNPAG